jgi:RNA polymerase sigma-70 factor (ECF subfamily)
MQPKYGASTNPSIFLRLNAAESRQREMAWDELRARYAPFIAGFARRLGARPQDADDVIQDVLLGFFLTSPTFVYDPSKGRFRRYLKVCTYRMLQRRLGKQVRLLGRPIDEIDPESPAVDEIWTDAWERELVTRAIEQLRTEMKDTRTFDAFERYVIREEPAADVARALGLHINSVYRAKEQVTRALAERVAQLRDQD